MDWQPINFITPRSWYRFWGGKIWKLPVGIGAAFSYRALYFGFEVFSGDTRGIGFGIGPFWIGFAALIEAEAQP
jgi:hypothetical protein